MTTTRSSLALGHHEVAMVISFVPHFTAAILSDSSPASCPYQSQPKYAPIITHYWQWVFVPQLLYVINLPLLIAAHTSCTGRESTGGMQTTLSLNDGWPCSNNRVILVL